MFSKSYAIRRVTVCCNMFQTVFTQSPFAYVTEVCLK